MIPTGQQIADAARIAFIGDTENPSGSRYTDGVLKPAIDAAYRILYSQMMLVDERKARKTIYFNLPAFTGYLTPAAMGIQNMGTPKCIWDRGITQSFTATVFAINNENLAPGVPPSVDLTILAHGLSSGTQVIAFGFSEMSFDLNDIWSILVVDSNTIRLLGCAADSISDNALGSQGIISTSGEDFPPNPNVDFVLDLQPSRATSASLSRASWVDGAFRFIPATTDRQVKVLYTVSGTPPANLADSIGIDNSMEFLACYAAALSSNALGATNSAQSLFALAVGNTAGDPGGGDGGFLGQFLRPHTKANQNERVIIPPFRPRRNRGWVVSF